MNIKEYVDDLNTTAYRIVQSVWLTTFEIVLVTVAIIFGWEPTRAALLVLGGIAVVLLTMQGFDVLQYLGKRWSDREFAIARNPSAVQAENVERVTVESVPQLQDTKTFQIVPQMRGEKLVKRESEKGDDA